MDALPVYRHANAPLDGCKSVDGPVRAGGSANTSACRASRQCRASVSERTAAASAGVDILRTAQPPRRARLNSPAPNTGVAWPRGRLFILAADDGAATSHVAFELNARAGNVPVNEFRGSSIRHGGTCGAPRGDDTESPSLYKSRPLHRGLVTAIRMPDSILSQHNTGRSRTKSAPGLRSCEGMICNANSRD